MRILLDSDNSAIFNIVNLCCERTNIELITLKDEPQECAYVIKDCNFDTKIDDYDFQRTLFLVPRYLVDDFKNTLYLPKPFLPIDLIKILKEISPDESAEFDVEEYDEAIDDGEIESQQEVEIENKFENIEFIEDSDFSENIGKTKQDLMHEIDDLQLYIKENFEKQDELTQKILSKLYENNSADKPIDEIIQEYKNALENTNLQNLEANNDNKKETSQPSGNFDFQVNKMLSILKMADFSGVKKEEKHVIDELDGALDLSNTITVFAPIDKERVKASLVKIIKKHLVSEIQSDNHLKEALKKLKLDINISLKER